MNDIFEPQARFAFTITNFENGKTFTPMDVFRNLFNRNVTSSMCFANNKDEWDMERNMREELNQMIFGSWHAIGTDVDTEPTPEQLKKYTDEATQMVHFMLYNASSPLQMFKKSWRQFYVQITDDEGVKRKTLSVDKVEEFFEIGVTNDARRFAESFYLAGESQDWYLNRFGEEGMSSCCFEDTQLNCVARYIKMVLNIYADTIHFAERLLKEGQDFEEVKLSVSVRCASVQGIADVVMAEAKVDESKVVVYKMYGDWVVAYFEEKGTYTKDDAKSYECANMVQGREWARVMNATKTATNRKVSNTKTIKDLKAQLEIAIQKEGYLENEEVKAMKEQRDFTPLVQLLN